MSSPKASNPTSNIEFIVQPNPMVRSTLSPVIAGAPSLSVDDWLLPPTPLPPRHLEAVIVSKHITAAVATYISLFPTPLLLLLLTLVFLLSILSSPLSLPSFIPISWYIQIFGRVISSDRVICLTFKVISRWSALEPENIGWRFIWSHCCSLHTGIIQSLRNPKTQVCHEPQKGKIISSVLVLSLL